MMLALNELKTFARQAVRVIAGEKDLAAFEVYMTIELNEFDEGIGSGSASGVAFVPAKENAFIAETFPEITVPIRMPTTSVAVTNPATTIFRRLVQSTISLT